MAVFRVEKSSDFTIVANCIFRDYTLSAKAKGLLVQMLSVNEKQWDFTLKGLAKLFSDGLDSIRRGVQELEEHGYVVRKRVRDARGRLGGTEYLVYESPHLNENEPVSEKPEEIFPAYENPTQDEPTEKKATTYKELNKSSTKEINTVYESNPILSEEKGRTRTGQDAMTEREKFAEQIYHNISYEVLAENPKINIDRLKEIVQLIIDTGSSRRKMIRIASDDIPVEVVREQFLKLTMFHIEYVFEQMSQTTTQIRNIKQYLLAALYNATLTMDNHYSAKVNYDLKGDPYDT